MNDPYSVLGLQRGASVDEAKSAFKRLAKECHPDLFPNDPAKEARFKEINSAFDAIENPERVQPGQFHPGQAGFHFTSGNIFDDLFANLHRARNNNLQAACQLTLEEAFTGKTVDIQGLPGNRPLQVQIPPGVIHGMQIIVQQAGENTINNQRPGDLYIQILIVPHPRFVRDGNHLHTAVTVSALDVLKQLPINTIGIDGQALQTTVPSGFDTGQKLRFAGQGMSDRTGRGDLFVELKISFPTLTADQRQIIEQLSG